MEYRTYVAPRLFRLSVLRISLPGTRNPGRSLSNQYVPLSCQERRLGGRHRSIGDRQALPDSQWLSVEKMTNPAEKSHRCPTQWLSPPRFVPGDRLRFDDDDKLGGVDYLAS